MVKNSARINSNILSQTPGRLLVAWTSTVATALVLFFAAPQAQAQTTVNAAFTPDFIAEGETSTLTLTITHINASFSLTSLATNVPLPLENFRLVDTRPTINTCPTTVNTSAASAITLTAENTPALPPSILGVSCTIAVSVVALGSATSAGAFTVPANALRALRGASVNFPVQEERAGAKIGPPLPIMTVAVNPTSAFINAPATLIYTLTNPRNGTATTVNGILNFPAGIIVGTLVTNCGVVFSPPPTSGPRASASFFDGIIAANGSCTITTAVQSSVAATYTFAVMPDDLNFGDTGNSNVSNATLTVSDPAPAITITTSPVVFGLQTINTTSPAQLVTLTNSGNSDLTLNTPTSTGPFAFTSNCPFLISPVRPGGSCTFTITFTPSAVGAAAGTIDFASNASLSPTSIVLSGIGSATAIPGVAITPTPPTPLTFAAQTVATTSTPQNILLTNTGSANLVISSIAITGGAANFRRAPRTSGPADCVGVLAPNTQCAIAITFTPQTVGASIGNVQIVTNATPTIYDVSLNGIGAAALVGILSLSEAINFGDQIIGTSSDARTVFISNVGNGFVFVNSVGVAGPNAGDFQSSGICGGLIPGASCAVNVSFNPATIGPKSARLAIGSNALNAGTVNAIGLSGNGAPLPRPVAVLNATAVGFGNTIFGGAAAPQTVTLSNNGTLPLLIQSAITSAEYTQTNNCPTSLNPQASCTILLTFMPFGLGPRLGELVLNSNAADSPSRVFLGGNGCRWFKPPSSRLFANICRN
jgi:hypothetical protein